MTASPLPSVGMRAVDRQIQDERLAAHQLAQLERPAKDIGELTDAEFEAGIKRVKITQERMTRLLAEVLVLDVHYGQEKDSSGNPVFKKPRLKKAGAEELRRLLRLTIRDEVPATIVSTPEIYSVVVTCGIYDHYGRLLAIAQGACNTKEKRFKKYGGGGWTYTDPREEEHNCLAMARKRAGGLLTAEASGATGFFANGEEFAGEDDDKVLVEWTAEERALVLAEGAKKSMGRKDLEALAEATLGRARVGTGEDVNKLLNAIAAWQRPPKKPQTPAEAEQQRIADLRLDQELAEEES